jgi:membrane fusion protein (multidrug efflux system)
MFDEISFAVLSFYFLAELAVSQAKPTPQTKTLLFKNEIMKNKIFMILSTGILLGAMSCQTETSEKEEATNFLVSSPLKIDTTVTKEYVCQIHAIQHIEIRALERGYLQKIYVDEGQFVKKGQLMFQIMPLLYKAETQKAQAEANYAEIEYKNTKALADKNVVSKNELALARAKYDKAKAELALTKVHLGFTEIRAPFDGIMDRFQVRLGSLLEEGDLLTTLSDNSKIWVYYNVPEAEYLDYKMEAKQKGNMVVSLLMANGEMYDQPGIVETIEADFNNETGNIDFRATFKNPDALLRHGETGNILMDKKLKKALIIPQKATFEILEKKYVYVVDKNNEVHSREITIKSELPDIYVIDKGIKPTDRIVVEGIRKVKEGEKIHYTFESPKSIISRLKVYVE